MPEANANTKLHAALALADRGFHVFRLKNNSKIPYGRGWQAEATNSEYLIKKLFENSDFNIGILTEHYDGQALVVVDVDTKEGKKGNETIENLDVLGYELPPTATSITASGGQHKFYTTGHPLKSGAHLLGPNVDIKSHGGYVVGAGSTIDGHAYRWEDSTQKPAPAPDWLIEKVGFPRPPAPKTDAPATLVIDAATAIERARRYLTDTAPPAIQGNGGNEATLKAALQIRDFAISEPLAIDLMHRYYNPRCQPSWNTDELERIIANAYRYAQNPLGSSSAHAEFEAIPDEDIPATPASEERQKLFYRWFDDIHPRVNYIPLVENLLDQGSMSVMYGESNTGKTFVAMDIAFHIATGRSWHKNRTAQGSVLYIAAEGGRGAEDRVTALQKHYRVADVPLALVPCPVNLFTPKHNDIEAILQLITQAEAERGPMKLIVVDTLARVMSTGNENSGEDMNRLVNNIDHIRNTTKAHLMVVHHSGKDTAKGARGHSSLRAATDTEIEIVENTVRTRKQRDMGFAPPIGFKLKPLEIGKTAYGETLQSCVVELGPVVSADSEFKLDHRDAIALQSLKETPGRHSERRQCLLVDQKEWATTCKNFDIGLIPGAVSWPTEEKSFLKAFKRSRDRLVGFGLIREIADKQWVVEKSDTGDTE